MIQGKIKLEQFKLHKSTIAWTEATHNFWQGCHKISEGCKFCYMYRLKEWQGTDPKIIVCADEPYFSKPLYIQQAHLIFTNSMSDFFIEEADPWRDKAWDIIKKTPQHTYQILTKRPERIMQCLPPDWGANGYPNVWLGVSVESEKHLDRIEILSKVPTKLRFVSAEPLLEYIDFKKVGSNSIPYHNQFDWLIIGGESGFETGKHKYRPCEVIWIEKIVQDIRASSNAKIFIKQMGTYLAKKGIGSAKINKWKLETFHGDDKSLFPQSLQIQDMP